MVMATQSSAVRKIHDAAVRLFTERGARDLSVSDLAQAAGVARGTIYNNIADPAALFDQVAANLLHDMHLRVSGSMRDVSDPASRIAIGIRLFVRHSHEDPAWARFVVQFGSSDDVMRRMLDEPPTADLTRGMQQGRFNITVALLPAALSLVGGTTLAAMQGVLAGRQTWRDAGEQVAELVLKALGLPPDEARAIATAGLPALAPPNGSRSGARSTSRPGQRTL
jgi:AcrR family transcriptional regulator